MCMLYFDGEGDTLEYELYLPKIENMPFFDALS